MAAQQGFLYEENASNFLKKYGLVPKSFVPAGSGSDQPDLMLLYNNKQFGCELKITAASAGSLVIKYDKTDKRNPWKFGDIKSDEKEKLFIAELAEDVGLFALLKKNWKDIPSKYEPKDDVWKNTFGRMTNEDRYRRDLSLFPDVKGEISATKIEEYYNKKKTYYVNVGTHGFYLLGAINPFKLKNVPRFGQAARATYRARVQYKGGGNHQFTFEMQFSMKNKSPFNIAPVQGSSVNIYLPNLNLEPFGLQ
jgi:hypothetical protein